MTRGEQRPVTLWRRSLELLATHMHAREPDLFDHRPWDEVRRDSHARGWGLPRDEAREKIHGHSLFVDPEAHSLRDSLMELVDGPLESLRHSDADLIVQRAFLLAKPPLVRSTFEELWRLDGMVDRVLEPG